jgi:hypothetical protein
VMAPGGVGWRLAIQNARANSKNPKTLEKFAESERQRTDNLMAAFGLEEESAGNISNKISKAYESHLVGKGGRVLTGVSAAVVLYEAWKALNSNAGTSGGNLDTAKGASKTQPPIPQPTPQK